MCAAGTVVVDEPSATNDRTCEPCRAGIDFSTVENASSCNPVGDPCDGTTTYETQAPTVTQDRICSKMTECIPGEYVLTAGTTTTNRICEACTAGTDYSTTTNAGSCTPVTACDANASESSAPTANSDRVCDCNAGFGGDGVTCTAILCDVDERVVDNVCVACDDGSTNEAGDNA